MQSTSARPRIAVIGECLIELSGTEFDTLRQSFGGDTLNTALYLSRLLQRSATVQYVTVLGGDTLSAKMQSLWQSEGIDVSLTLRDPTRLPGMYQIQVDARGERRFLYWRQDSAARYLLRHPDFDRVATTLIDVDLLYVSGISLAILPLEDRARLIELLLELGARGVPIAFDTNYRAILWPSTESARDCIAALLPALRIVFATHDDEQLLWGDATPQATIARFAKAQVPSIVVKSGAAGCLYSDGAATTAVPASPIGSVVDTTAAGDSFNAGFLAAWLTGIAPLACAGVGNALAGTVIQHRGAIIPPVAMPTLHHLLGIGAPNSVDP